MPTSNPLQKTWRGAAELEEEAVWAHLRCGKGPSQTPDRLPRVPLSSHELFWICPWVGLLVR